MKNGHPLNIKDVGKSNDGINEDYPKN